MGDQFNSVIELSSLIVSKGVNSVLRKSSKHW